MRCLACCCSGVLPAALPAAPLAGLFAVVLAWSLNVAENLHVAVFAALLGLLLLAAR